MVNLTCSIADCGNKVVARGWCNRHYLRWRNHGDPLGGGKSPSVLKSVDFPDGTRACSKCSLRQPLDCFQVDKNASKGRRSHCASCRSEIMKLWYAENQPRQVERARSRFQRDIEKIRENDMARYLRHRRKRIESASEYSSIRRARLVGATVDSGITVRRLRARDGDLCVYCKCVMRFEPGTQHKKHADRASIEHIIPISRGGVHSWENVTLCCLSCNVRKNSKTVEEWGDAVATPETEAVGERDGARLHSTSARVDA